MTKNENDSDSSEDMFATDEGEEADKQQQQQTDARSRLSKWAARLFDPNRPRGLVEAPQVIPLNDEFLIAFGKREKERDHADEDVDDSKIGDPEDDDDDDTSTAKPDDADGTSNEDPDARTVRCINLAYRTSSDRLKLACERFGTVLEVTMLLDDERKGLANVHNSGRAFVQFQTVDHATACVEGLKELDGRELRLNIVKKSSSSSSNSRRSATASSSFASSSALPSRYWGKDISTVCRRCEQVGHKEASCPNPAKPKPCPLCASTDHHEPRECPSNRACFNCGVVGHLNRDCPYSRIPIRRMICGICFRSGHHRLQCRERAQDAPSKNAVCMVCQKKGHFLCRDVKWFYSLDGMSCFNCGQKGHSGYDCRRPSFLQCHRNPQFVVEEIDRAPSLTKELAELEMEREKERGRRRDQSTKQEEDRKRPRSQSNNGRSSRNSSNRNRGYR